MWSNSPADSVDLAAKRLAVKLNTTDERKTRPFNIFTIKTLRATEF